MVARVEQSGQAVSEGKAGETKHEWYSNIPLSVSMYLDIDRGSTLDNVLDYKLYEWAIGDGTLRNFAKMMMKYGSPYISCTPWWHLAHNHKMPNYCARNALRRWANEVHGMHLPYHELPISEIITQVDNVENYVDPDKDPTAIVVVGDDVEEVKIYKRSNGTSTPEPLVRSVLRKTGRNTANKVSRLGISVNRPEPANSLLTLKSEQDMTWDELIQDLVDCYLDRCM